MALEYINRTGIFIKDIYTYAKELFFTLIQNIKTVHINQVSLFVRVLLQPMPTFLEI